MDEKDLYEFLISGTPEQAQIPMIVEQLRRRRALGELGALTGDRVLQPFGSNMISQTDKYASDLQGIRQKDVDNAQTAKYQDAQVADLAEKRRIQEDANKARAAWMGKQNEAALIRARAAMLRAQQRPQSKPLPPKLMNDLNETRQLRDKVANLKATFKDEYAKGRIPGMRTIGNAAATWGIGSEESLAAANWWRQFDFDFTLPFRNATFGATLSQNEQRAWKQANAGKEMSAAQIKDILNSLERWQNKNLDDLQATYSTVYDPGQVSVAVGKEYTPPPPAEGEVDPDAPTDDDIASYWENFQTDPGRTSAAWSMAFPDHPEPASYSNPDTWFVPEAGAE